MKERPKAESSIISKNTLGRFTEAQHRHELSLLRDELRRERAFNADLQARLDLLERIDSIVPHAPRWTVPNVKKSGNVGLPVLVLSDCHFDEVVNPHEVEGVNKFDRAIALRRLKRVLSGTHDVVRNHIAGITYEGFILFLGGDLLSGNIHEELQQTNEDTVLGSIDYWADQLTAFIGALADDFGKIHIAGVVGNHGRLTRKPRAKQRVRDNFDWLLYRIIARALSKDSRITWQIPESADTTIKLYNTTYRLTHGDQFRGGSGIAGMMSPLFLGHHRKAQRQMALHNPCDWLVMGHWHEYWMGKNIIVNGSLKGYDEYAYLNNFSPQRPIQALWITTPEHGATFPAPIFADDRKSEGW